MLEYFEPLMEWLKNTNANEQRVIGWEAAAGNGTNGGTGELFPEYGMERGEGDMQIW